MACLLLALLLFSPCAAFGGGASETATAAPAVTLRVLWWGGQARHDATLEVLRLYEERHPEVVIQPSFVDWNGYWETLYVMAAAEDLPDVYQMVIERIPLFAQKGLLADLAAIPGADWGGIDPAALDLGRLDARLLAIPLGVNAMALGFDPARFLEAGVETPSPDWTWADLRAAALGIRSVTGTRGLNGYGSENDFAYFVRSRGGEVFNASLDGPGWARDSDVADYFAMVYDFKTSGVVPPAEDWMEDQIDEENSLFARGKAAMRILWSNKAVSVAKRLGSPVELATPPGPGIERGLFLRPAMFFCASSRSAHLTEAARFLSYFVRDVEANKVLGAERGVPVVGVIRDTLGAAGGAQARAVFDYIGLVTQRSSPISLRIPPREGEYRELLRSVTLEVAFGRLGPERATAVLKEGIVRLLTEGD